MIIYNFIITYLIVGIGLSLLIGSDSILEFIIIVLIWPLLALWDIFK